MYMYVASSSESVSVSSIHHTFSLLTMPNTKQIATTMMPIMLAAEIDRATVSQLHVRLWLEISLLPTGGIDTASPGSSMHQSDYLANQMHLYVKMRRNIFVFVIYFCSCSQVQSGTTPWRVFVFFRRPALPPLTRVTPDVWPMQGGEVAGRLYLQRCVFAWLCSYVWLPGATNPCLQRVPALDSIIVIVAIIATRSASNICIIL